MTRSHPEPEEQRPKEPQPRLPMSQHPNPFLRPKRQAGPTRPGQPGTGQQGRPAHLPRPRALPKSMPRPRPVRRGGMR